MMSGPAVYSLYCGGVANSQLGGVVLWMYFDFFEGNAGLKVNTKNNNWSLGYYGK